MRPWTDERIRRPARTGHGVRLCRARGRAGRAAACRLRAGAAGRGRGRNPDHRGRARAPPPGARLAADGRRAARTARRSAPKRCFSKSTRPMRRRSRLYRQVRLPRGRQAPQLLPVGARARPARLSCGAIFASQMPRCGTGVERYMIGKIRTGARAFLHRRRIAGARAACSSSSMKTGLWPEDRRSLKIWHQRHARPHSACACT